MCDTKDELIGKTISVVESNNKCLIGIKGIVLDETRETILIGKKKVLKKQVVLDVGGVKVKGHQLVGRPEERIKW